MLIDALQYARFTPEVLRELREGGVDAVHVTIAYHETLREALLNVEEWNERFRLHPELVRQAFTGDDVRQARADGVTAVILGFQNPSPIEDDLGLVKVWHRLGVRFMQLTYNNQSLLASGCYEADDTGLTRMGREVVREMNRVGMVIDMSHSGERSTLEAIEASARPIAITHANPAWWHDALRNKSDRVLRALAESGGMLGFSLYPHHLRDGSRCTLESFCAMVAECAGRYGVEHLGLGSDLCQGQPDSVVEWMRNGRWTRTRDFGEGSADKPGFPPMPAWFENNRDWHNVREGLGAAGLSDVDVDAVMGNNWLRFFDRSFGPEGATA